jgi:hypothetical protein
MIKKILTISKHLITSPLNVTIPRAICRRACQSKVCYISELVVGLVAFGVQRSWYEAAFCQQSVRPPPRHSGTATARTAGVAANKRTAANKVACTH